jgi:hypothetical protein
MCEICTVIIRYNIPLSFNILCPSHPIYDCTNIKELKDLNCSECPLLTHIPDTLVNLTNLNCYEYPLLTHIPDTLVDLTNLNCDECHVLTHIPDTLVRLTSLDCSYRPLLTHIPGTLVRLTVLDCSYCPLLTHIPDVGSYLLTWCYGCKWLDINNYTYNKNILNLVSCQRIFKNRILCEYLVRLSRQIIPIWWDPKCKGGYFHKKIMLEEIEKYI